MKAAENMVVTPDIEGYQANDAVEDYQMEEIENANEGEN